MTCGIYLLSFKDTSKVYIGQSLHIEDRFAKHINKLLSNSHSVKMIAAYKEFGLPELEILEECVEEKLNELENYHIKLWNAVDNGFNSLYHAEDVPIIHLCGEDHGMSKYSNEQIKEVFFLLVEKPELIGTDIEKITKVSLGMIRMVASCSNHLWLKKEFPIEYAKLEKLMGTRVKHSAKDRGIAYPLIKDLQGNTYNVENTGQFARDHNLDQGNLYNVLRGVRKSHKGWTLA